METKNEFLKNLALIVENIDKLSFSPKKSTIKLYFNKNEFDKLFRLFTEKKNTENDIKFEINIDSTDIEINKII